jgi:WD40 repeat protein
VSLGIDRGDWGQQDGGWNWLEKASALQWWEVPSGRLKRTTNLPGVRTFGIASNTKKLLVATAHGNLVRLWDACTGNWKKSLKAPASAVAFSPDGRFLAAGGAEIKNLGKDVVPAPITVTVWDAHSLKLVRVLRGPEISFGTNGAGDLMGNDSVSSLAFVPGDSIIAATSSQSITMWNMKSGLMQKLPNRVVGHEITVAPDDSAAAIQRVENIIAATDTTVYDLYDTETWKLRPVSLLGSAAAVEADIDQFRGVYPQSAVAFSPDSKTIANDYHGSIMLRDTRTGELKKTFAVSYTNALAFSPNSRFLASANQSGICLWSLHS